MIHSMPVKTILLTVLALTAFAANSVFCRMALGGQTIDAAGFTIIRLVSGALTLGLILLFVRRGNVTASRGSWSAGLMLFAYAVAFSYAYITLDTGTGALILFGSVQITMIAISLFRGNRLHLSEWTGVSVAFGGFIYLVLPGVSAPSASGFALMTLSGIAWGIYTLIGRGSASPLSDTTYNFLRTLPLAAALMLITMSQIELSGPGVVLAMLSGAIASGMGYSIWYLALPALSATQAAVVQLSVPVIAALGGVLFMAETVSSRLMISSVFILGGILLVVLGRRYLVRRQ